MIVGWGGGGGGGGVNMIIIGVPGRNTPKCHPLNFL